MPKDTPIVDEAMEALTKLQAGEITPTEANEIALNLKQQNKEKASIKARGSSKANALNDRTIKAAKPKEKDYKLTDGEGLFLLVAKTGGKRWRFKYRFDTKEKNMALGTYPAISLSKARELKNEYRAQVANGISPADEKKKEKQKIDEVKRINIFTFEKVASELLEEWREKETISEATYKRNYLYLNKDAYPIIGNTPVGEITPNNIKTVVSNVADRGAKESSRKLFYALSKIFRILVNRNNADNPKYNYGIEFNPCKLIEITDLVGEKSDKHYPTIIEPKEIKALLSSISGYKGDISTKRALELMPYTALRPGNVRLAEWSELDLENKLWVIPAKKMKTRNNFSIPLTDAMVKIFKKQMPLSGDDRYVFPSPSDKTRALSDNALNGSLRRLGYSKEEFTAHGFRAMFSTIVNERTNFKHEIIESCLAHSVGSNTSRAYNRADYLEQRKEVMQWWSDYLDAVKELK